MSGTSTSAGKMLSALSADKLELLKLLREEESRRSGTIRPYPRDTGADAVPPPASWGQQWLWFIDSLEEGRAGYQLIVPLRLRGELDERILQKALDAVVQRHEVLRTNVVSIDGEPKQKILAEGRFELQRIDLSGHAQAEHATQVRIHKSEEARTKFDLANGPLIRGRLLKLQDDEHHLIITLHHIICDGWSKGVLIREIAELYSAFREGRSHSLKPLSIQFADYAYWQRQQWLPGESLNEHLGYWCAHLQGAPPKLELPTDRPRPRAQSFRGENVPVLLDAKLSADLRGFAQRHDVTTFMVLYAALALLLSRLSGQEDVVIGTQIANRPRPELNELIGMFVNTLMLRVEPSSDMRMTDFLQQVKRVTLGAYDHQSVPLEKVTEALKPQRSLSHNPLFQVVFVLHNEPRSELRAPGLKVFVDDEVDEPAVLDLWLSLEERDDQIVGSMNYAMDILDRSTVERWMDCFYELLREMTREAKDCVGDLSILPPNERHCVIEKFGSPAVSTPRDKLLHELFEEQVERAVDEVAIIDEDRLLTYRQLNQKANQLARYLRAKGLGPDRLVALCMERSAELIIGALGVLKAGGAYIPLDPGYPPERLAYMCQDASPCMLLTQDRLRSILPPTTAEIIALDGDWAEIGHEAESNLDSGLLRLTPRHLAYVIYTSGSTGAPKGVAAEHCGMVNRIAAQKTMEAYNSEDVCCHKTSIGFVDAIGEMFGALSYGRPLALAPAAATRDVEVLASFIESKGVTRMVTVPSLARALLEIDQPARTLRSLRSWTLSGEEIKPELLRKLGERLPACRFINLYGSSEVAADVTCYAGGGDESLTVPIGKPIESVQVYILDQRLQPVPIGVTGEIYVGGACVARGYLNRPELTAERFIADRFRPASRARLFKSGDLGRWRPDGQIEYLGRNDGQVKIRGFRIEVAEIEAQLAGHPQLREAAVVAREDAQGDKQLIAYITCRNEGGLSIEELRDHLKRTLPEYMVPSAFVILESLPLTQTGKLDRLALGAAGLDANVSGQYEPAKGEVEESLVNIWQELLLVERVGRRDNFFELGGHSLIVMQLIARIEERLRVRLSAVAVFRNPTVHSLAELVGDLRATSTELLDAEQARVEEGVI